MKKNQTFIPFYLVGVICILLWVTSIKSAAATISPKVTCEAIHLDPDGIRKYDTWEEFTEDDLLPSISKNRNGISENGLTTGDTGLFGTGLVGDAKVIYDHLQNLEINEYTNTMKLTIYYPKDSQINKEIVKNNYRDMCIQALYANVRDHQESFLWATNKIAFGGNIYEDHISMAFKYYTSEYYSKDLGQQLKKRIDYVVNHCQEDRLEVKLRYYHDWLLFMNQYDYRSNVLLPEDDNSPEYYFSHSAVGCLVKGTGVCESYAKAMKIFCDREKIPCLIVTNDSHAWNYIKMDDEKWYMIDCTWDETTEHNAIQDTYFLISNFPYIDEVHTTDRDFDYPMTAVRSYAMKHHYKLHGISDLNCSGTTLEYHCKDSDCADTKVFTLGKNNTAHTGATEIRGAIQETCGADGYSGDLYCITCNDVIEYGDLIPATGNHTWDAGITTREGTCIVEEQKKHICEVCGQTESRTYAIAPENHSGEWVLKGALAANYRQAGYTGDTYCPDCNAMIQKGKIINRLVLSVPKVVLSTVKNSAKRTMKVVWKKNAKSDGYQLQYSLNRKFTSKKKTVNIMKNSVLSKSVKKLSKGKTYYVRIRAYKKMDGVTFYSPWSVVKKVKIKK